LYSSSTLASSPLTRDFSASNSFTSVEAEEIEVDEISFVAVEGSLFSFLGLRFGCASLGSAAGAAGGLVVFVDEEPASFLGPSFSSTTPPAEPARPAVAASTAVAGLRERVCFGGAVFAVDEEGWGFVAILSDSLDPDTSKIRSG
jgi:hypothetical protein